MSDDVLPNFAAGGVVQGGARRVRLDAGGCVVPLSYVQLHTSDPGPPEEAGYTFVVDPDAVFAGLRAERERAASAAAQRRAWEARERWRLRLLAEPGRVHRRYRARQVARRRRRRR